MARRWRPAISSPPWPSTPVRYPFRPSSPISASTLARPSADGPRPAAPSASALEREPVEEAYPNVRRAAQPARKPKTVAVVGAGLAGLTAAFDLVMKGHAVTVFEADAQPLGRLHRDYRPTVLSPSAIAANIGALMASGPGPAAAFACMLRLNATGRIKVDRETLATSHPKVFASGLHDGTAVDGGAQPHAGLEPRFRAARHGLQPFR